MCERASVCMLLHCFSVLCIMPQVCLVMLLQSHLSCCRCNSHLFLTQSHQVVKPVSVARACSLCTIFSFLTLSEAWCECESEIGCEHMQNRNKKRLQRSLSALPSDKHNSSDETLRLARARESSQRVDSLERFVSMTWFSEMNCSYNTNVHSHKCLITKQPMK